MIKKIYVLAIIFAMAGLCVAAIAPPKKQDGFTNLKLLPKDISPKQLQKIMFDDFQDGLGVSCGFCHAQEKNSSRLDYASDEKPEKEIARVMMRMTMDLNKNYFGAEHPVIGDSVLVVTCSTCHKGMAHPEKD